MARSARKIQELRDREEQILEVCRNILIEKGYPALSMDRIAEEMGYSKGTIYLHFKSKEDVLSAVAVQTHLKRIEFFDRVAAFEGRHRERILAFSIASDLFIELFPTHFHAEQIILLTGDPDQLEGERLRQCYQHENQCFEVVSGVIRDAAACGDLKFDHGMDAETFTFGLWSMSFGAHFLGRTLGRFKDLPIEGGLFSALRRNMQTLMDGVGFKPLTGEWDYAATEARIRSEIFPDECAQVTKG